MSEEKEDFSSLTLEGEEAESENSDFIHNNDFFSSGLFRGQPSGEEEASTPLWLLTFTDITALMLTFFVLLYSMSSPKEGVWHKVTTGLDDGLNKYESAEWHTGPEDTIDIERLDLRDALDLKYLQVLLGEMARDSEILRNSFTVLEHDRLIISFPNVFLFSPENGQVSVEGKKLLFTLGGILTRVRNNIEIVGHVLPRDAGVSDWQRSVQNAGLVASILGQVGYERATIIRGQSTARFEEISASYSQEEKEGMADRTDIIVLKDGGVQRSFMDLGTGL